LISDKESAEDYIEKRIRTKDGKETDFLITKNDVPWCLFA